MINAKTPIVLDGFATPAFVAEWGKVAPSLTKPFLPIPPGMTISDRAGMSTVQFLNLWRAVRDVPLQRFIQINYEDGTPAKTFLSVWASL